MALAEDLRLDAQAMVARYNNGDLEFCLAVVESTYTVTFQIRNSADVSSPVAAGTNHPTIGIMGCTRFAFLVANMDPICQRLEHLN